MKITAALILLGSLQFAVARPAASGSREHAAPAASPSSAASADTNKIHSIYLDGDFEQAIQMTEGWLNAKSRMSHADSIFAFKHLGVMYAARNDTREKGKYYMLKLLEAEPTARILDMYASDMIYMIFKNIREEFEANQAKLTRAEDHLEGNGQPRPSAAAAEPQPARPQAAATPVSAPARRREEPAARQSGGNHALYWVGGAALLVGAGVATYFILDSEPTTKKIIYDVN
jgi:hypothetical protein